MRVHFGVSDPDVSLEDLRTGFGPVRQAYGISWRLHDASTPTRTLIMVSKFGHCLNDLLFRKSTGALSIEIPAIVSNHRDFEPLAQTYGVPFHHIPVTKETKAEAEARLLSLVDELDIDLVVLARYMQILSDDLCKQLDGRAINIHPFLPSFKGSTAVRPGSPARRQARRGHGALRHARPRRGPDHRAGRRPAWTTRAPPTSWSPSAGTSRPMCSPCAVEWHSESRVLTNGSCTVVFR